MLARVEDPTIPFTLDRGGPKLQSHKIRVEVVKGPDQSLVVELARPRVARRQRQHLRSRPQGPDGQPPAPLLRVEGDAIRITDAGSRNGTLLDSVRILDAYARPDSTITIGSDDPAPAHARRRGRAPALQAREDGGMIGRSIAMRRVFALIERVAPTDTTVLIEGETGTGKELAAEALHDESRRAGKPFIVFDCSAVSSTLIESELFGHVRGAFTGAVGDRPGAFEAANGRHPLHRRDRRAPLDLQPKLLRVLEQRRCAASAPTPLVKVDVRIVAATNRSLALEVERGRFREDLYYRLAVDPRALAAFARAPRRHPAPLSPFRDQARRSRAPPPSLPESVVDAFAARSWPGNVRELRNEVARAVSLGIEQRRGSLAFPSAAAAVGAEVDFDELLFTGRERVAEAYERAYLERALQKTGGNVSRAAELAGVNRKFIQRAMKRFGLRGDTDPEPSR
jgi:transcriptional regulator with GAF, ATPase, and Fis domain